MIYTSEYRGKIVYSYHPDLEAIIASKGHLWDYILDDLRTDWIVVDVGSHIGLFTLLVADKVKKVYSIEPHPLCFKYLKKNVEENNLTNVECLQLAIATEDRDLLLYEDPEGSGGHSLLPLVGKPFRKVYRVRAVRWDTLLYTLELEKVDLAKIHLEGLDLEVLKDMTRLPDRLIVSHWHGYFGEVKRDLESELKKKGYQILRRDRENYYCRRI